MDFEMTDKLVKKFWNYVDKTDTCWNWDGRGSIRGYGYICVRLPQHVSAHRFSWMLHNGAIPKGMVICHKCDRPCCVNPNHLFMGTQSNNVADKVSKGRGFIQLAYANAHLSADQIKEIRASYKPHKITQQTLAKKYGVTRENIHYILKGKSWGHLDGASEKDERIKLTDKMIQEIRHRYQMGRGSHRAIARQFGVSKTHITRILSQP